MHTQEAIVAAQSRSVFSRANRKVLGAYWWGRVRLFRALHATRPASLRAAQGVVSGAGRALGNPLAVAHSASRESSAAPFGQDGELSRLFRNVKFDDFALRPDSLAWLVRYLEMRKPRSVLEFGSGLSTLAQCAVLSQLHGPGGFRFLSFDQDATYARQTRERIQALPGSACCRVVHVPLIPVTVAGYETESYDLSRGLDEHWRWLGSAEFVFIDGPFAEGPCRYGTVPAVREHLAHSATLAMDDGLREKELIVGHLWQKQRINIRGVLAIGNGIMIGSVSRAGEYPGLSSMEGI
jgi:hypothetical protein